MPHIIIEHSDKTTAQMPAICAEVFTAASKCSSFPDASAIKVRSVLCANHTGGTGDDFVHATIKALAGRDDTQKAEVTDAVMNVLNTHLTLTSNLTVEFYNLHTDSYRKRAL